MIFIWRLHKANLYAIINLELLLIYITVCIFFPSPSSNVMAKYGILEFSMSLNDAGVTFSLVSFDLIFFNGPDIFQRIYGSTWLRLNVCRVKKKER